MFESHKSFHFFCNFNLMKNYFYNIFIVLAFLFLNDLDLNGQVVQFRQIEEDHGLPLSNTHRVFSDDLGYVWIENKEGLSRFDGVDFKVLDWNDIPSVSNIDSLQQVILGRNNKIYGIRDSELFFWQSPCPIYRTKKIITVSNGIFIHHTNVFDESELIFVSEGNCLNYHLNEKGFEIKPIGIQGNLPSEKQLLHFSIVPFSDEEIIVNIPHQKLLRSKKGDNLLNFNAYTFNIIPDSECIFSSKENESIGFIRNDSIIIQNNSSIKKIAVPKELEKIIFLESSSNSIFFGNSKQLFLYDLISKKTIFINPELHLTSSINHIGIDKENNLWISSEKNGIYCVFPNRSTEQGLLGKSTIHHLFNTKSLGLLAASDEGLFIISSSWGKFPLKEGQQPQAFYINEDIKNNIIYISTNEGIYSIKNGIPELCLPKEKNVHSFLTDDKGYLSFYRNKFLHSYLGCHSQPYSWPIPDYDIGSCLYQDHKKRIWLGTEKGLLVYDKNTPIPKKINTKNGLPHSKINDITQDEKKNIWIGTDGGLAKIFGDSFDVKIFKNLPSLKCRKIIAAENEKLWVADPNGIFVFDPFQNENSERVHFPQIQTNTMFLDETKKLWVGTNQGLFMHDPERPHIEDNPPALAWRHILLNDKKINPTENPDLNFDGKLNIGYTSIVFKDAHLISYQYRLNSGVPWQNTKNREIIFSNLQPGKYNLQIRARKPSSEWSTPLEFPFCSLAPWWKTWTFIIFSTLGLLSILFLTLYIIRSREKRKIETNKRFAELELKALQAQMNPHFIFNTLNAIQHSILKENTKKANESLNSFASLMRLFLESSKSKYIPLSDEIRMLNHYCELTRFCYEEQFDFSIKIDPEIDEDDTEIPSMLLQPYVENAIRHGLLPKKEKGSLDISFSLENDKLFCRILDNGVGRAAAKKIKNKSNQIHKSAGMSITNERADILNEIYASEIDINIVDLKNKKGDALGTDVRISFLLD